MMKRYDRETTLEILVGFFVFVVLITLATFTIVLSSENIFEKHYPLKIQFTNVGGLTSGDNVHMRGVKVGVVKKMHISPTNVTVFANLKHSVKLHRDYKIEVMDNSVLGGKFLNINQGSRSAGLIPDDAQLVGSAPVNLVEEMSAAVSEVREALGPGGLLKNTRQAMANINLLTSDLRAGKGTFGKLLQDESVYLDLKNSLANLDKISDRLASGKGTLGRLLSSDDTLYRDLESSAQSLRRITDNIASGKGTLGKLVSTNDTLYADLQASASSMRDITAKVDSGEGTLGKIIMKEGLYDELKQLVSNLRAAIDDKREASALTSFSSVFFGSL